MSSLTPTSAPISTTQTPTATQAFLASVEAKTTDTVHLRLLKAAGGENVATSIEGEFRAVISEIVHAN